MLEVLVLRERGGRLEPSRLEIDPATTETVRQLLQRVFVEGDDVLLELAERFDGCDLSATGVLVTEEEFAQAERDTPPELRTAIDELIERLRDLSARQLPREWWDERDGVRFGEVVRPLASVGCYVPGGRARYPSSVCMTVVPAVVAGVGEIVLCTPPQRDGSIHAAVLYAARRAGATYVAPFHGSAREARKPPPETGRGGRKTSAPYFKFSAVLRADSVISADNLNRSFTLPQSFWEGNLFISA
jgi:histidinol dehydrogenase